MPEVFAVAGFLSNYQSTFTFGLIYGLFALATYAALSCGVLSLAAASFGAVGGFSYAKLQADHSLGLAPGLIVGMLAGGIAALLLSYVVLRLSSHYVAMATIALVLITRVFVLNLPNLTGGANGIAVPRQSNLWWVLGITAVCLFVFWRLAASRYGLAAATVREDPQAASTLGVDTRHIQRVGFVLSGAVGGLAGVLMADQLQYIGPNTYYIDLAFTMLAAVILGGAYHWCGPIVGAMVFRFLPEVLADYINEGYEVVNGILLVVIMVYLPRGIVDPERRRRRERPLWPLAKRPGSAPEPAIEEQTEAAAS